MGSHMGFHIEHAYTGTFTVSELSRPYISEGSTVRACIAIVH